MVVGRYTMAEVEMVWALAGPVTHGWVHVILNSYSKTSMEQVFGLTPLEPQRPRVWLLPE